MPSVGRVGIDSSGGLITGPGVSSVKINGSKISVVGDLVASHGSGPHAAATMLQGSSSVFAGGKGICRQGDSASCGHTLSPGSPNVSAN